MAILAYNIKVYIATRVTPMEAKLPIDPVLPKAEVINPLENEQCEINKSWVGPFQVINTFNQILNKIEPVLFSG